MFRLLIAKELRETILTAKFAATFGVCTILILVSFYVGARNYQVSQEEYEAAVAENLTQMEGLTEWSRISHRISLPPQPLAALVSGISNDIGRTADMRTRGELRFENSRYNEDPIFAVFRFLDLEFLFTTVLSLFAVLFAFDAINGEKERGTLRLSFAAPVAKDTYILSKLLGSFVALTVPLLIPILIGSLLLPILGVPLDADSWLRLGLIILAGYLYLGVFLCLSIFISTLTQRSASSFLLILVFWIVTVMVIPRTAVLVAGRAVDVPSVDMVNFEKNRFRAQLLQEDSRAMRAWQQENPMSEGDGMQWVQEFMDFMNEQSDVRDEKMEEFSGRLNEERRNRESVRQSYALGIARISPTSVFSILASRLAATSLGLKERFQNAAYDYQSEYAQFQEQKGGDTGMMFRIRSPEDEEPEPIDLQELPVFEFRQPPAADLAGRSLVDLGLLLGFNILFFAGSFVAFLRYDVR